MANSSAISTSFKVEMLEGIHALGTTVTRGGTGADTIKAALFLVSGNLSAATTAYSTTSEIQNASGVINYNPGGVTVTNATPPNSGGTTAFWTPSAAIVYSNLTCNVSPFDTVQLYNSTQSNRSILTFNFGSTTITAGTLTLNMPANAAGTALLNFA